MQIIQINVVGAQLLQGALDSLMDVFRTAIEELLAGLRMRRALHEAELCRQEDILALARLR